MAEWINSDGLRVRFGTDEAITVRGGEVQPNGELLQIVFKVDLTQAATGSALIPNTQGVVFPAGLFIDEVEVRTDVAVTSSGSGTLNVGLNRLDTTTVIDADGLVAALSTASMAAAGTIQVLRVGSTGDGALVGTALANPGVLVFDWDTGAFQTGVLTITVRGHMPWPAKTN